VSRPSAPSRARIRPLALALALAALVPAAARGQSVHEDISPLLMNRILTSMGFEAEQGGDEETPSFKFELGGWKVVLFLANKNTDAQLYVGFLDTPLSFEKANDWNRRRRFARAYQDEDGDAVLEADLDFTGGVTEEAVKAWIRLFRDQANEFAKLVR
jgi:hypothetical protein